MSIVARILALLSETGSPRATLTRGMGTQLDLPFGHELPSRPPSQFEPTQMPMEGIESPDPLPRQLRMLLEQETYPYGPSAGTPTGDVSIVPEVPFVPRHAATSEDRMLKHIADLEALGTRGSVGAGVSRPEPEPMVPGPELFPGRLMPGEGEDPRAFLPRFGREAEVVGAQPEGLDLEGPSLLLDQPLDRQMREAGQLSRKVDESVQRGLDYTQDAFAESLVPAMGRRKAAVASLGEDPAQDEWVRLLRDKAMETPGLEDVPSRLAELGRRVRTPLEGSDDVVAESGLTVPDLRTLLSDVRRRLRAPKMSQEEHLGRITDPLREQQAPSRLADTTETPDPNLREQYHTLDRLDEKRGELVRRGSMSQPARTREAAELLRIAASVKSGKGDISDFAGGSQKDQLLRGAGSYTERQRISGQARGIERARVKEGKPLPALKGLQQYQTGKIEMPFQYENIVDPESVTSVRPGVDIDPFAAAKEGQIRSVIKSAAEIKELGLKEGDEVTLRSGDGEIIKARVVGLSQATVSNAAEIGLRSGIAPEGAKKMLTNLWAKSGPQVEVIFKPVEATRPGLEDPLVTAPALASGREAAREAVAGVTAAKPRLDLGLDPKVREQLDAAGFGKALNALDLPKSKDLGSPYMLIKEDPDPNKWEAVLVPSRDMLESMETEDWIGGKAARRKALGQLREAHSGANLKKLIGKKNIEKNMRRQTTAEFRASPRDPLVEAAEPKVIGSGIDLKADMRYNEEISQKVAAALQQKKTLRQVAADPEISELRRRQEAESPSESDSAGSSSISARPDDRRDLEFRPTSVGRDVTDPKEAIAILKGAGDLPKGTSMIVEHWEEKYPARTRFNTANSDATLAIAADFSSGGETLTRSAAGQKYVPVESFQDFLQGKDSAVHITVAKLNQIAKGTAKAHKPIILNIAGNSMSTLGRKARGVSQAQLNEKMKVFLERIVNHPGRNFDIKGVITGGQTGMDEAGIIAARALGLPNVAVLPKKFQVRDTATGVDVWTDLELQKRRFAGEDVSEALAEKGRIGQEKLAAWKKANPNK